MIKLAMEIPKAHLKEFSAVCDYDFAIAHYVLQDAEYARFYKTQREKGRYVILDNGFHELGHPLSNAEIIEAAKIINPNVIIAPDWLGKAKETLEAARELFSLLKKGTQPWNLGVVLQGENRIERFAMYDALKNITYLWCLPYRVNRVEWLYELADANVAPIRLHLLGMNEREEIQSLRTIGIVRDAERFGGLYIDTAKPIKWGMQNMLIDELPSTRNSGINALSLFNADLDHKRRAAAFYNVAYLRRLLA